MEKFNTATIVRNGFVTGIWALSASIQLNEQHKVNIKTLIAEKQKSLNNKFNVIWGVVSNDYYKGCNSLETMTKSILRSIIDNA